MDNKIIELKNKFEEIKKKGWIKSAREGTTGIGYTFEKELGKKEDNLYLPDYNGIEIKTKHHFSKGYITLFNLTPDGEILYPTKYLKDKYGYPDKINRNYKVLQTSIKNNEICKLRYYYASLEVNHKKEKIYLVISKWLIDEKKISWTFKSLRERLYCKIEYLAIVEAATKFINGVEYIKYYKITFYKLRSFEDFLKLVENGDIRVTFKVGTFTKGKREGQTHDHGTGFDINRDDIEKLFEKINI